MFFYKIFIDFIVLLRAYKLNLCIGVLHIFIFEFFLFLSVNKKIIILSKVQIFHKKRNELGINKFEKWFSFWDT